MTGNQPLAIAIVGMSCKLPGADGLEAFWDLLRCGRDAVGPLPDSLLDRAMYFEPTRGKLGKTYSCVGGLISHSAESESEWDTCHEIFYQVARQACEHAGYGAERLAGRRWGVYVGHSAGSSRSTHLTMSSMAEQVADLLWDLPDFQALSAAQQERLVLDFVAEVRQPRPKRTPGGGPFLAPSWAASLVAKNLQLQGPAAVIDAACASSLVALALGILALRSGEVEAVIVGGASHSKLESLLLFSQAQSCSATGSRPFDQEADGLISSEGHVALVLKTLSQAQADKDTVYAVIQGLGLSSDGKGRSLWAPNPAGQRAAMERAYGTALQPSRVQYLEAHATSTQVGDATELESLIDFFGPGLDRKKIPIGSVKSNLGHTLETAGLASLLKVVLAMQHQHIPPTLHVHCPNQQVDWEQSPFEVAGTGRAWPENSSGSRCAAVSAFGIGGLNVHLVVEQLGDRVPESPAFAPAAVAVIGRGVVVAGAQSVPELARLIQEGRSQIQPPPPDRWRQPAERIRGGYIPELRFDCVHHKVAPRAFRTGNPLQFMLLSAADQALQEIQGSWQAQDTLVMVGTTFGGEFSDQLGLGLRFPELRLALQNCLAGLSQSSAEHLLQAFEKRFFEIYPAMFDETGSFTSSTLASRLSKTYNLMGGALALDGGECSSHMTLKIACDMLSQGVCSTVVCAGGQRSLNWAGFEQLELEGQLASQGLFPGEGAGVVVLKRLDDAERDGNQVLAVLHGGSLAFGQAQAATQSALAQALRAPQWQPDGLESLEISQATAAEAGALASLLPQARPPQPSLAHMIGQLQAAQGVVSLIRASLQASPGRLALAGLANGGQACVLLAEGPPGRSPRMNGRLQLGATDLGDLRNRFLFRPNQHSGFSTHDGARLQILQPTPAKLELARHRAWDASGRALLQEQGVFISQFQPRARLALVFSGQGSQYQQMLGSLRDYSPAARQAFERADRSLAQLGLPDFDQLVSGPQLDEDPVVTQLAVLVADYALHAAVLEWGFRPHCLCGHSFGEIPALLAADVLTLEDALQLTQVRARALLAASPDGGLLSVKSDPLSLQTCLDQLGLQLYITHLNAPQQTVVGGRQADLRLLQQRLEEERIASRMLRVPGALHTPLVEQAQAALAAYLQGLDLRPPSQLVYSNVTNRPCHSTAEIRQNLLDQLVQPVHFMQLQERLYEDGVRAFLEVGPGQVLCQLMRQNLGDREVLLLGCDHPQRSPYESLSRAEAALQCLGITMPARSEKTSRPAALSEVLEYDATTARKDRRREKVAPVGQIETPANTVRSPVFQFVLDYLVDLTGFSADVIDVHWDLEADLGIDSIKRVQLFGELKGLFSIEASDQQLAQLRTLDQIVAFVDERKPQEAPGQSEGPGDSAASNLDRPSFEEGLNQGRAQGESIRRRLREAALLNSRPMVGSPAQLEARLSSQELSRLRGLAQGAGVHIGNLVAFRLRWGEIGQPVSDPSVTRRYVLRMLPCPTAGNRTRPKWYGRALIMGDNPVARQLQEQLVSSGCHAEVLNPDLGKQALLDRLGEIWSLEPAPHLFLVTPHDQQASTGWNWASQRRQSGLEVPFWFCQQWLSRVKQSGLIDHASLVAVAQMGGQFGIHGALPAPESGGLCGLLKSISIEGWVAGHRSLTVQTVDTMPQESAQQIAERVLHELANPSYDREIGWLDGQRAIVWAQPEALPPGQAKLAGNWVCTGGARGITAYLATELATRYNLRLHLIGRAPTPQLPTEWVELWPDHRRQLRLQVMEHARAQGLNSVRHWEEVEKALEISHTLTRLRQRGVEAHYYSCDLADAQALAAVLQQIRGYGPIEAILHGAGISRDAKFEQKEAHRVEECFRAKIDGTLNLMNLTRNDALKYFVGFGSISGRFGANGHADYSLANDMLAKLVGWYRQQRPDVGALTFHWHAWGDVGMAVRGETELGLKKIDMQFMPAQEGLQHLIAELMAGAPEPEVLITSPRYYNQFYFSERISSQVAGSPLLQGAREMWLDPQKEVFLKDHLMQGLPVLPLAVSLQLLWEASALQPTENCKFLEVEATSPLKFFDSAPRRVRVSAQARGTATETSLTCEVLTRSGQVVDSNRLIARALIEAEGPPLEVQGSPPPELPESAWKPVFYHEPGADMVHGPSLRALRQVFWDGHQLWGQITAPPLMEVAGSWRSLAGWRIPSALLDACFYATGILAWQAVEAGQAVPQKLGQLWLGRQPVPGEMCEIHVRLDRHHQQQAVFSFTVWGHDGQPLVQAQDFSLAWFQVPSGVAR